MVGSLFFAEDRHRRQYAGQVAGQEDNGVRLATEVFRCALLDQFARVGGAAVLGQAAVGVVGFFGDRVEYDVFQYGAVLDGFPDDRLVLLGQVDALGIATAFDVEHHAFAPAVLVVTDQVTAFVGGQGGLAGAGQTEEQGYIALFAHVGRAVHRQHVGRREQEVLHREHGFLHFAGITHACDQHLAGGEVDDHGAVGVGAVTLRVADEPWCVLDFPLVLASRVVLFGVDEQATAEQIVPRSLGGHLDWQVVRRIGAYMNMGNEALALGEVRADTVPQGVEFLGRELAVDRAPGDGVLSARLFNDETIDRRTASTMACLHNQCASIGQYAFFAGKGFLDQFVGAQIGVHSVVGLRHEVPRRPVAECSKRFCSKKTTTTTA
ncbi:Uncharacterized protein ALO75_01486 [Pseudomonas syringae pv. coryli]|uniref:Uncharacterized protein n=1 Tax=Pseudomonas syringae pv. coryli TaxID=317659 RepID=A0A0P9MUY6_9PSED|nr:Uncharacterized protein ALO75_01486 [Pseudomonas syringae pv. coryli]